MSGIIDNESRLYQFNLFPATDVFPKLTLATLTVVALFSTLSRINNVSLVFNIENN